jgi:hypothetical protein
MGLQLFLQIPHGLGAISPEKIVYLILTPFQILSIVSHKIICSNLVLFLDQSS